MIIKTNKGKIDTLDFLSYRVIDTKRVNAVHPIFWIITLLACFPLLIFFFFIKRTVYVVDLEIESASYIITLAGDMPGKSKIRKYQTYEMCESEYQRLGICDMTERG